MNYIPVFREGNEPDDTKQITYGELLKEVCKFSNVLISKGQLYLLTILATTQTQLVGKMNFMFNMPLTKWRMSAVMCKACLVRSHKFYLLL